MGHIRSYTGSTTPRTDVIVSPQFFAWVLGFGESARIIGPQSVAGQMRQQVQSVAALY